MNVNRGITRLLLMLSVLLPPIFMAEVYTYNNDGQFFDGWQVWPDSIIGSAMIVAALWFPKVVLWVVRGFRS